MCVLILSLRRLSCSSGLSTCVLSRLSHTRPWRHSVSHQRRTRVHTRVCHGILSCFQVRSSARVNIRTKYSLAEFDKISECVVMWCVFLHTDIGPSLKTRWSIRPSRRTSLCVCCSAVVLTPTPLCCPSSDHWMHFILHQTASTFKW